MAARPALFVNLPHCTVQLAPAGSLQNNGDQMNGHLVRRNVEQVVLGDRLRF